MTTGEVAAVKEQRAFLAGFLDGFGPGALFVRPSHPGGPTTLFEDEDPCLGADPLLRPGPLRQVRSTTPEAIAAAFMIPEEIAFEAAGRPAQHRHSLHNRLASLLDLTSTCLRAASIILFK